jgi:hypothetical protein
MENQLATLILLRYKEREDEAKILPTKTTLPFAVPANAKLKLPISK